MSDDAQQDRRKHDRTTIALLVQYRFNSLEEFLAEYATNLSPGGMFISTETPAAIGTTIHLQFALKDGSRLIDGLARVVRVVPPGAAAAGMGVEFLDFDQEAVALLGRICGAGLAR